MDQIPVTQKIGHSQLINALRGHLAEFGWGTPKGPASLKLMEHALAQPDMDLPNPMREMAALYLDQINRLTELIEKLAEKLDRAIKTDEELRRVCTVPGIGPVTAGAIAAFALELSTFDSGRNFAAWLGLVPRQRSIGGTRTPMRLGSAAIVITVSADALNRRPQTAFLFQ